MIEPSAPTPTPSPRAASPAIWIVSLALAAIVGALLFVGGYLAAGGVGGSCAAPTEAFKPLCQAYGQLKAQYVDPLNDRQLAEGAIRGMFEYGVKDPFSGYMSPDDYESAQQSLSGTIIGIGAEMGVENTDDPNDLEACNRLSSTCALVVIAPLEDTPAERAGLKAGDRVLAIDGDNVNGSTLNEEVGKVRGEAGTDVTLTIERDGRTFDLTITRAEIQTQQVSSRMLDDKIGYIALHSFSIASTTQFHDRLEGLLDDGATSIIFDLRDNPGGYIDSAAKIASEFIGDGVIFSQESAGGDTKRWDASSGGVATDTNLPVVVLVNNGSASASEIVAAALRERGRATLVGQHTYGKNTVQLWDPLDNGGAVRITISRWFTPDHHSVAPDGIQPDEVVQVPEDTPPGQDLYLERAVQLLQDRAVGGSADGAPSATASPAPAGLVPVLSPLSYDPRGLSQAIV
jgi:carboxyl-terminal processing protease